MLDLTGKKILLFSDTHLASKGGEDNFGSAQENKLIEITHNVSPDFIIIVGDFLELWQANYDKIWEKYRRLFAVLKFYNVICILGNHDHELMSNSDFPFKTCTEFNFSHNGKKYHCEHGHRYDLLKKKWWKVIIPFVKFYGYIERLIFRKAGSELRILKMKKRDDHARYESGAKDLLLKNDYDTVIFGHTHHKQHIKYNNKDYINLGCWVGGDSGYLVIEKSVEKSVEESKE